MTTEFTEFASIAALVAEIAGQVRGLRNSAARLPAPEEVGHVLAVLERLPRQLHQLEVLVGRACDQVESVARRAAQVEAKARQTLALVTGPQEALREEFQRLREQAKEAVR